ncbi:MAG: TolC family protein [Prevotella sp.]|nr:TolC family protein [Prevotella sp.]
MRRLFFIVTLTATTLGVSAQRKVTLDLNRTVALATDSSLTAEKYRSVLDTYRFSFLAWQASRKPQITLDATPLQYEQYMVQRYISDEDRDTYREQQMLYSEAAVGMTQDIEALGGTLYASTGLGFLHTFGGDTNYDQFSTVPIKVGYRQDLLGFNALKWSKRLEPLKLKKAEKAYAYNLESTAAEAVDLFFQLALAQDQLRMAEENLQTCDTIYAIGCRRFKIASISKAELSILDLQRTNATNTMENAKILRDKASKQLATFLGMERDTDIELIIPTNHSPVKVDAEEALRYARENNPAFIETRQAVEEARMEMEKAKVERRLSLNIDASIGLNQVADKFWDAYRSPLRQEKAMVTLSVPLKDWGKRKNNYLQAQSRLSTAEKELSEATRDTELDVVTSVDDYNKRHDLTANSRKSLNIAQEAYDAMLTRFIKGQATVNDLSLAQNYWQTARQNYTQSLQNYWTAFYRLRQLTLYDFNKRKTIEHNKQ